MKSLKIAIKDLIQVSDLELEDLLSFFHLKVLKKNEYFLVEGYLCNHIAFVKSGMLRKSNINEKGVETICCFLEPSQFVTSFSSFISPNLANENIQSISDTELYVISKQDLELLNNTIPSIQEFIRKVAEQLVCIMENRINHLINNTAEERYHLFLKNSPELLNTISLQQLASFLGITPQHLSRIKKIYK